MVRLFGHWISGNTLLQMAIDLALLCVVLVLAVAWLDRGDLRSMPIALPYIPLFPLGMMAVSALLGIYRREPGRSRGMIWRYAVLCWLLAAPMAYGVSSLLPQTAPWREDLGLVLLLAFGVVVALRVHAVHTGYRLLQAHRIIVLGTGADAAAVEKSLARSGSNARIVGFYSAFSDEAGHPASNRLPQDSPGLVDAARRLKADEIVVAVRERRGGGVPVRALLACKLAGMRVLEQSSYFERALGQVRLDSLRASWLIFGEGFRRGPLRSVVKRLFDLLAGALLLLVFWPLMLLCTALIMLEGGAPILYRQDRVGQGGRIIRVVKFRSMRCDAEGDGQPRWAASDDARVTRIGRILRRYRIDELPQLWNVLTGDMSLVGPRPERPYFVTELTRQIPFYAARHSVKPGVTGWAQVRFNYGVSVEDAGQKLQYDLYYVKNHSLFLDTLILLETVRVVLTGAGAR